METRCPNCGSPITIDEVTRGSCSSCTAVLPHVMRAQQQAMAFRMALGAPPVGPQVLQPFAGMQQVPHAPNPRKSSAIIVFVMLGVMVAMGVAGAMVFFVSAPPTTPRTTAPRTTPTTGPLARSELHACRDRATLRSRESSASAGLAFKNDTAVTMSVSWIDTNGRSVFYRKLAPGESYLQPSFATHPWLVEDDKAVCQGIFVAREGGAFNVFLSAVRDAR